jgi:hypothetical protein
MIQAILGAVMALSGMHEIEANRAYYIPLRGEIIVCFAGPTRTFDYCADLGEDVVALD